jgi:HemX protein
MFGLSWIYDLIIYLYAISVLLYFSDFMSRNPKANRIAFWVLTIVWGLQTIFFVSRMIDKNYLPVITQFETLFFYSWLLVTLSLIMNYFFRIDFFLFFTNVVGFAIMVMNLFSDPDVDPKIGAEISSHIMFIHITLAFLSYAAFLLSGVSSLMYIIQDRLLKEKRWTPLLKRLPSIGQLSHFSYLLVLFGVPLLVLSLILGSIWAYKILPDPFWLDPKVWFSILVLIAYSIYLYGKTVSGWIGRKLALWNMVAFVTVLINYLISRNISIFHQWL